MVVVSQSKKLPLNGFIYLRIKLLQNDFLFHPQKINKNLPGCMILFFHNQFKIIKRLVLFKLTLLF